MTKSSLYHKARTAGRMILAEQGELTDLNEAQIADIRESLDKPFAARQVADAAAAMVALALAGLDPEAVLSDILFRVERSPEGAAEDDAHAVLMAHLNPAPIAEAA